MKLTAAAGCGPEPAVMSRTLAWRTGMLIRMLTLPGLCMSSLRRGHANLLCTVQLLTDDPRRESTWRTGLLPEWKGGD